jgi:peptide/nickel transport system substrate-binding protein
MKSKILLGLILALCIMMLVVTFSAAEAKMGGVLKVVLDADPPTLDPHASSTPTCFQYNFNHRSWISYV